MHMQVQSKCNKDNNLMKILKKCKHQKILKINKTSMRSRRHWLAAVKQKQTQTLEVIQTGKEIKQSGTHTVQTSFPQQTGQKFMSRSRVPE